MTKRLNFQISMLATVAAVGVTALNIYSAHKPEPVPQEFAMDLPSRGIAGVDAKPDLKHLYETAREYSANGRFDECLAALNTIHQEVTEYEGSRELKSFCTEGKARKVQAAAKRAKSRRVASRR
jgi:hypothetical protein